MGVVVQHLDIVPLPLGGKCKGNRGVPALIGIIKGQVVVTVIAVFVPSADEL